MITDGNSFIGAEHTVRSTEIEIRCSTQETCYKPVFAAAAKSLSRVRLCATP